MSSFDNLLNAQDNPNLDICVFPSPDDTAQTLSWSPKGHFLVAGAWDSQVRCWEVQNGKCEPRVAKPVGSPILHTSWNQESNMVFIGAMDGKAYAWDLASNNLIPAGGHQRPVKFVSWIPGLNVLMTASWDKKLCYWDGKQPNPIATIELPERVYSATVVKDLAVVAMADRQICIIDLKSPDKVHTKTMSPLKFQTRVVSAFPDATGYAIGSVEGRVGINYIQDESRNFAFKCHRGQNGELNSVHDISIHPTISGAFSTCGSDGVVTFWDKNTKSKGKTFKPCPGPVVSSAFSGDGRYFAYSSGYDWGKGFTTNIPKPSIFVHAVTEEDFKPQRN